MSTPIGNLADMTERGLATLRAADLVLCEDTRTTAKLLAHFGLSPRTRSLHDHNEDARIPSLLARLEQGATLALVSDAGTPTLSDPGFRLVRAAIAAGHHVTAAPGANAVTTALSLSGLPPHPFLFAGFPPPRAAARRALFARLRAAETAGLAATLVFYESPARLPETLADACATFGDRDACVARELTKRFEEVTRAPLSTLAARTDPWRGEITLLLAPPPDTPPDTAGLDTLLTAALTAGTSLRDAAEAAATATGVPRRAAYKRALELQAERG